MTIIEIEADLISYADFEEVSSVARAKLFITAAKRWLILRADSASSSAQSMSIGKQFVENMLRRAMDYVAARDTTASGAVGGVRFLGVGEGFR